LDEDSATNPDNYEITPGIDVTGAELVDEQTVRLTTSPITEGAVYTLTVNNVTDQSSAGNEIAPDSQIDFLQVQGVITEKEFRDIPGPLLSDLTGDENFPDNPDAVVYTTEFETLPLRRDNYGVQFQGFVIPPETGEYVFYVSSRDQSVLFLSPDENPANMVEIAREPEFSSPRDWESQRDGEYKRYFQYGEFTAFEQLALGYLRRKTPRGIVISLLQDPSVSASTLAVRVDVSPSTISKYTGELRDAGLLREGGEYQLVDPETMLVLLVRYADSFGSEAVMLAKDAAGLITLTDHGSD
jgi:DNA-binding transcriptional ArsR family regulator